MPLSRMPSPCRSKPSSPLCSARQSMNETSVGGVLHVEAVGVAVAREPVVVAGADGISNGHPAAVAGNPQAEHRVVADIAAVDLHVGDAVEPDAEVVVMKPAIGDRQIVRAGAAEDRLVKPAARFEAVDDDVTDVRADVEGAQAGGRIGALQYRARTEVADRRGGGPGDRDGHRLGVDPGLDDDVVSRLQRCRGVPDRPPGRFEGARRLVASGRIDEERDRCRRTARRGEEKERGK